MHNQFWFNVCDEQSNSAAVFNVGHVSYNYYNLQERFWALACSLNSSNSVWLVRMSLCRGPSVVNWAIREANYFTRLSPCTEVIQRHVKLSVPTGTNLWRWETSPVRPIKAWKQPLWLSVTQQPDVPINETFLCLKLLVVVVVVVLRSLLCFGLRLDTFSNVFWPQIIYLKMS